MFSVESSACRKTSCVAPSARSGGYPYLASSRRTLRRSPARTDSRWVQSSFGIRRTISVNSRAISLHGGVETAHRLLATDKVQDGLGELFLLGRLDLTVEHHVLLPEFVPLFSDQELAVSRTRLGMEAGDGVSRRANDRLSD